MAASANPSSGGHSNASNGNNNSANSNGGAQENVNGGGGGLQATENSVVGPTQSGLRHNPGISLEWTEEEQSTLEDLLATIRDKRKMLQEQRSQLMDNEHQVQNANILNIIFKRLSRELLVLLAFRYASETTVVRYAKIAQALRDKTVRDVAMRCRWMSKKENSKRRKDERKNKEKKEKTTDSLPKSSQVASRPNGPPYAQSMMSMDSDDGVSFNAIGGAAGQLLEQNAQALDQISANFSACKIHENINLFCQARNNILSILNDFTDTPEIMKQMPPLPVKLNEELANSILPRASLPKKS